MESRSGGSEPNFEAGSISPPSPKRLKTTKSLSGAALYKTKFNPAWKKEFPFITSVEGDVHM